MNVDVATALSPTAARTRLDSLSDGDLDVLPFGVIALDREGLVRRYNLAEARFARLDRSQVIGKDFFRRVARCAATPAFEGRVRALFEATDGSVERFDYVFDFRFGAQEVEVEARRSGPDRVYLCVTRKRLLPPRPEGVAREPGVAQQELAPEEASLGVQRDTGQQRIVQVAPAFLEALLAVSGRPDVPRDLLDEWGATWGRLGVVEMEADALERFESVLRDLPMVTAAEFVSEHLRARGWGRVTLDFAFASRGALVLSLERSPLGEITGKAPGRRCALLAGFMRSILSHLAQRRLAVREVRCSGQGAPRCELVAIAEERLPALDAAIQAGADSLASVLERVKEARRS